MNEQIQWLDLKIDFLMKEISKNRPRNEAEKERVSHQIRPWLVKPKTVEHRNQCGLDCLWVIKKPNAVRMMIEDSIFNHSD